MTTRGFIVVGSESSGTRLLTRVLIEGGCRGEAGHRQSLDRGLPDAVGGPIVWRRSVPHDDQPVDLGGMRAELLTHGFNPFVVITVRNWIATFEAQVDQRLRVNSRIQAAERTRLAYQSIFCQVQDLDHLVVTYESLIADPDAAQRALWRHLGLPGGDAVEIRSENTKRLEGAP